jgi:hypothetical protein
MRGRMLVLTGVLAIVLLGACGDDDGGRDTSAEAQAFCAVAKPVQDFAGVLEQADDPKAVQSVFTAAEGALARVSSGAPAAIRDDLDAVSKTFATAHEALKKNGYDIATAAQSDPRAIEALDDPSLQRSSDNIQAWAQQNCANFR